MNFEHTYINLLGVIIFEPLTLVANTLLFLLSLLFFFRLRKIENGYARNMAWFIFLIGLAAIVGAVAHAVQYQMGSSFLRIIMYLTYIASILAAIFCFLPTYYYSRFEKEYSTTPILFVVVLAVFAASISVYNESFLPVKFAAALALMYALYTHYFASKSREERGNTIVVTGILVAFLPIVIHSLKLSIDVWFNYKDISHFIMILSLILLYKGIYLNAVDLLEIETEANRSSLKANSY